MRSKTTSCHVRPSSLALASSWLCVIRRAPLDQLLAHYQQQGPRGEITLVISGGEAEPEAAPAPVSSEALQGAYETLLAEGLGRKAIFAQLQQRYGLSRNELYARLHQA